MPSCRECHVEIDKEKDDWIMPSKNYYYHRTCYETWKARMPETDDDWVPRIYDFLARDLKVSYNYFMCEQQRKKFGKDYKINNKGIYFTLKYFYEIKGKVYFGEITFFPNSGFSRFKPNEWDVIFGNWIVLPTVN